MNYRSITHITANEDGCEELSVEFDKTFFQLLFKRSATVKTYVYIDGAWRNKNTGKPVRYGKESDSLNRAYHYITSASFR